MMQELAHYLKVDGNSVHAVERGPGEASSFWAKLRELAPWLQFEFQQVPGLRARVLTLSGAGPHGPMSFVGDVELPLLGSLVHALRALATGELAWESAATKAELAGLNRAVELDLIVSALCPFCASVSEAALRFAAASPSVAVSIQRSDAIRLPENVHTLPTILADGAIVARGVVEEYALVRQIAVYQRSIPPSGVDFTPPSLDFPPTSEHQSSPVKSSSRARPGPAASRRPRRPTAA